MNTAILATRHYLTLHFYFRFWHVEFIDIHSAIFDCCIFCGLKFWSDVNPFIVKMSEVVVYWQNSNQTPIVPVDAVCDKRMLRLLTDSQ